MRAMHRVLVMHRMLVMHFTGVSHGMGSVRGVTRMLYSMRHDCVVACASDRSDNAIDASDGRIEVNRRAFGREIDSCIAHPFCLLERFLDPIRARRASHPRDREIDSFCLGGFWSSHGYLPALYMRSTISSYIAVASSSLDRMALAAQC